MHSAFLYPFQFFLLPDAVQIPIWHAGSGMDKTKWRCKLAMYKEFSHAFEFYSAGEPTWIYDTADMHKHIITEGSMIVYMNKTDSDSLAQSGFVVKSLKHFDYFRISMLTGSFKSRQHVTVLLQKWKWLKLAERIIFVTASVHVASTVVSLTCTLELWAANFFMQVQNEAIQIETSWKFAVD